MSATKRDAKQTIRCAIYTRKSTEEGLDREFTSLDSQREYAESYIKSQSQEGWICLADRYDDGGFSGGNMDRPALRRLLNNIESGQVDCVVAYKIDRLSRSLLDFAKMMEVFERHSVSFVSVTQQINTANSMGRLMQNVLLSFAQFEREIISERTRDKIAATRRKGKWSGGMPLLGYDVVNTRLVLNEDEAARVRQVFDLYLELGSLLPVVQELARRGWTTKPWTTKKGSRRGGLPITKGRLYQMLTNVTYAGKIRYKNEIHEGEHQAIIDEHTLHSVQATLHANGAAGGAEKRNKHGALLRGLLRCASCHCGMTHTYTKKGNRLYRYYVCNTAQQQGRAQCPAPSLPAAEIERFVVDEIKSIGRDPALVAATVAESRRLIQAEVKRLKAERAALERQRRADEAERGQLAAAGASNADATRLANVEERIGLTERRLSEVENELAELLGADLTESQVTAALGEFEAVWNALTPVEQSRVLALLIERVNHDGKAGSMEISFHPTGVKALAGHAVGHGETAA
jgi:site-specific DNA recombinase